MVSEKNEAKTPWEWKPKFLSEFSMGELDFRRYDATLKEVDMLSGYVNSCQFPSLLLMQKFYAQLVNLYDNWKTLINTPQKEKEFDDLIDEGKKLKRQWENNKMNNQPFSNPKILDFVDCLNKLKTKLYELKQTIGLGIAVRRVISPDERISKSFNKSGGDGLPQQ